MAIAVNGGHVARALDFYDKENKYFIIGGSQPWVNEPSPDELLSDVFKLKDVIGLKKVDNMYLVVPDNNRGDIVYRDQKWRKVDRSIITTTKEATNRDSYTIDINSMEGIVVGNKLRVANTYEGIIQSIEGTRVTLDTPAPELLPSGSLVEGGAQVEVAKYVYVDCRLEYGNFPIATYRQVGLCTNVVAGASKIEGILRSAEYNPENRVNEYESLGVLEILDNRAPIPRDENMQELISMIIEF